VIDSSSVQEIDGLPRVFAKHDDGFIARPVKVGRRDDKRVEILEGVKVGETIATSGSFLLKSEITKDSAEHEH